MDSLYKKEYGQAGEDQAADYLSEKGFNILERNYRFGRAGEIDIIAFRDNLYIFVEVKHRKSDQFGGALYSMTAKKKRTFRRVAELFINSNSLNKKNNTFRFDMISIEDDKVVWIEDIIR